MKHKEFTIVKNKPRMVCACGAIQTKVAYSPYYKGYMFACKNAPKGCRSQDEGSYDSEDKANPNMSLWRELYGLRIVKAGSLDPMQRSWLAAKRR